MSVNDVKDEFKDEDILSLLGREEPENLQRMSPLIDNTHFRETLDKVELQKKELPSFSYEQFENIANLASMVVEMLCENKVREIRQIRISEHKLEVIRNQHVFISRIDAARNQNDYLLYLNEVSAAADYVYTNTSVLGEDFLSFNQELYSRECLKLYPLEYTSLIHDQREFGQWMFKCADYEFRQHVILDYSILENILIYINQHIKEEISLSSIVEYCNISQGYLSKLFRKCFGITVMDYIHIRKVNMAKDMMLHTNKSIGDISFELSYREPGYFSKIFKKYGGGSAVQYKNNPKKA